MTRVLVVDDNPLDRRLAEGCVQDQHMEAEFANDGLEALAQVAKQPPDIILTDLDMPKMDGLELVKAVQKSHPAIPVILMTAKGSEEVAAAALQAGASSYVPKRRLKRDLAPALRLVAGVARARQQRHQVAKLLTETTSRFVLGCEPNGPDVLVSYLHDTLHTMSLFDDSTRLRVGLCVSEALLNARDHGNFELDSKLRDQDGNQYQHLRTQRATQSPYCDRHVSVTMRLTDQEVSFAIRDDGPGFDPTSLPNPCDPENLMRAHGRGLMLIRTFMDEVTFNQTGNEIRMIKRK